MAKRREKSPKQKFVYERNFVAKGRVAAGLNLLRGVENQLTEDVLTPAERVELKEAIKCLENYFAYFDSATHHLRRAFYASCDAKRTV